MNIPNKNFVLYENIKDSKDFITILNIVNNYNEDDWIYNTLRQSKNSVNNDTQTVLYKHFVNNDTFVDFKIEHFDTILESTLNIISKYKKFSKPDIKSLIIARLPPNKIIPNHIDTAPAHEYCKRVHFVMKTNPDVNFMIGEEDHHFEFGDVFEVNNKVIHGVQNNGDTERIHLIVDYK